MKRPFVEAFTDSYKAQAEEEAEEEFAYFSHDEGDTLDWVKQNSSKLITGTASVVIAGVRFCFDQLQNFWVDRAAAEIPIKRQRVGDDWHEQDEEQIDDDISIQAHRVVDRPEEQFLPKPIYHTSPAPVRIRSPMGASSSKMNNDEPAELLTASKEINNKQSKGLLKAATMNNTLQQQQQPKTSGGLFTPVKSSGSPMQIDSAQRTLTPLSLNKKQINFSPNVTPGFKDNTNKGYGTAFFFKANKDQRQQQQQQQQHQQQGSKTPTWTKTLRDSYNGTYAVAQNDDVTEIRFDLAGSGTRTPFSRLKKHTMPLFQMLEAERERREREREQQARVKSQEWNEKEFPSDLNDKEKRKRYDAIIERHKHVKSQVDQMRLKPKAGKPKDAPFKPLPVDKVKEVQQLWKSSPNKVLTSAFKIEITGYDLRTLKDGEWLNDNIIDYYLSMVSERGADKSFCFSTHFFTTLQGPRGYQGVARWAKKKKIDVTKMDYIFVPINRSNTHWCLAVINNKEKKFQFFDSMGGYGTPALEVLQQYMISETDRLEPGKLEEHKQTYEAYELCDKLTCPQQSNGSDCGVFTCKMTEVISRERDFAFSQKDMPGIRRKMVHEILNRKIES